MRPRGGLVEREIDARRRQLVVGGRNPRGDHEQTLVGHAVRVAQVLPCLLRALLGQFAQRLVADRQMLGEPPFEFGRFGGLGAAAPIELRVAYYPTVGTETTQRFADPLANGIRTCSEDSVFVTETTCAALPTGATPAKLLYNDAPQFQFVVLFGFDYMLL